MSAPAESSDALQDLGWIFGLIEVDCLEDVVGMEGDGGLLAGAQEVRDVLHLDEGHGRGFEADVGGGGGEVDESVQYSR